MKKKHKKKLKKLKKILLIEDPWLRICAIVGFKQDKEWIEGFVNEFNRWK